MSREHNQRAWDALVRNGQRFTRPAHDDDFANPLGTVDQPGWLSGNIRGQKVLCLAAGGGRQGPLYAAAGGLVTVVDLSPAQLEIDRAVAAERGLALRTVQTSMDDLAMFAAGEFQLVVQPVSTCYLPHIGPVFREVARVTQPGGLYISQHKSPTSLQCDTNPSARGYELVEPYYREGPLPAVMGSRHREEGTLEYLHRLEEILGGMCRAGFTIEDFVEPLFAEPNASLGSFAQRSQYVAPYVRIKARRSAQTSTAVTASPVWLP